MSEAAAAAAVPFSGIGCIALSPSSLARSLARSLAGSSTCANANLAEFAHPPRAQRRRRYTAREGGRAVFPVRPLFRLNPPSESRPSVVRDESALSILGRIDLN